MVDSDGKQEELQTEADVGDIHADGVCDPSTPTNGSSTAAAVPSAKHNTVSVDNIEFNQGVKELEAVDDASVPAETETVRDLPTPTFAQASACSNANGRARRPGAYSVFPSQRTAVEAIIGGSVEFVPGDNIVQPTTTTTTLDTGGISNDIARIEDAYAVEIEDAVAVNVNPDDFVCAEPLVDENGEGKTISLWGNEIKKSSLRTGCWTLLAGVVALVIGIPTAMHFSNNGLSDETSAPSLQDEQQVEPAIDSNPFPPSDYEGNGLFIFLSQMTLTSQLIDSASPQGKAYKFMYEAGVSRGAMGLTTDNQIKAKERYVMLVLYFSLGGDEWLIQDDFLTLNHHCMWGKEMVECTGIGGVGFDGFGRVTGLYLGKHNAFASLF